MKTLNEVVDKVYVLNLKRRPDRWLSVRTELDKAGIEYERFEATDARRLFADGILRGRTCREDCETNFSEIACSLSHQHMIKCARYFDMNALAIFEDDAILAPDFKEQLSIALKHLPSDWELLYLGANCVDQPEHVSGNIYRSKEALTTHAYLVNCSVFTTIIEEVERRVFYEPIDVVLGQIQKESNSYVIRPGIVYQQPGYSDIRGGYRNYDSVLKQ